MTAFKCNFSAEHNSKRQESWLRLSVLVGEGLLLQIAQEAAR